MNEEQAVVYVIDDDESIREALRSLLATVGLDVRTFAGTRDFLEAKRPDAASCLVLDVRLPGVSGLDFQGDLARAGILFPIIFISGHGDIPMTVRAIKAGAIEFLTKPFREQELLDAVQAGIQQDRQRRESAAGLVGLQERLGSLTVREREVMALVVTGLMNKQIAGQLNLSEITVKVHRGNVMHKMRAKSLAELVRMADKLGLSPATKT